MYGWVTSVLIILSGEIEPNRRPSSGSSLQHSTKSNDNTKKIPSTGPFLNTRSLKNHLKHDGEVTSNIHQFQDPVYSENNDIIRVNESWLNEDVLSCEILDRPYQIFRKYRSGREGEGVLVTVKKELFRCLRELQTDCCIEIMLVEATTTTD